MLLFFADLDEMKQINDKHGHPAGDSALIDAAEVLRQTFRQSDIVARVGGDEFAILAIDADLNSEAAILNRLEKNLLVCNQRTGRAFSISMSIGVAPFHPENPCSIDELLTRSDREMYQRKRMRAANSPKV
jgi:diguanylate cyclase (GGDEF)-like protein